MIESQTVSLPLEPIFPLAYLRGLPPSLNLDDRRLLVTQMMGMLENFYAHLPLKQAMLAIDPVQAGRLLLDELTEQQSEVEFLQRLLEIFIRLRDLHTTFALPAPYNQLTAFLPFLIEAYFDESHQPRYIVTNVSPQLDLGKLRPGVEVTHWNGTPMDRKILELAFTTAGANPAARCRRAIYTLTTRSLGFDLMPEEDWVTLTFNDVTGQSELRYPWLVNMKLPTPEAPVTNSALAAAATLIGHDAQSLEVQRIRKQMFRPELIKHEHQIMKRKATAPAAVLRGAVAEETLFPQNLSFRTVVTPSGQFGCLRIWNFEVTDVDGFVGEIIRILKLLPQQGIIIDVRGNPGGNITSGERILQLFTPNRIHPEPVEFRVTDLNRRMADAYQFLEQWRSSLNLSVRTGSIFSQGFPLTPAEQANDTGQVYPGRAVVIIDAMCYSTCCFFAAGFQDNRIGPIIGVDPTTGAGGANVWTQELLRQLWQPDPNSFLQVLPGGATMSLAVRRSVRVGANHGIPLEGLGVSADYIHHLTRNDLLYNNVDLFNYAGQLLASS